MSRPAALAACLLLASAAVPAAGEALDEALATAGGDGPDRFAAAAATPDGGAVAAGQFEGTVDLATAPGLTSAGDRDGVVVRYRRDGAVAWARSFGGPGHDDATAVAVADDGSLLVTGFFQGEAEGGAVAGSLTAAGSTDILLLRLGADGEPAWSRSWGGAHADRGAAVAPDGEGGIYLAGSFQLALPFAPPASAPDEAAPPADGPPAAGRTDAFLARLDAAGEPRWVATLGGAGREASHSLVVDAAGHVHWLGSFEGTARLAAPGGAGEVTARGGGDVFLVTLDGAGRPLATRGLGTVAGDLPAGLAPHPGGGVVAALAFQGGLTLPPEGGGGEAGAPEATFESAGGYDSLLVAWDGDGQRRWARHLAGPDGVVVAALGGDGEGVVAGGRFTASVDLDPGAAEATAQTDRTDAFAVALDPAGSYRWSRTFGGTGATQVLAVAPTDGGAWVTGTFTEELLFGSLRLVTLGDLDAYAARLAAPQPAR